MPPTVPLLPGRTPAPRPPRLSRCTLVGALLAGAASLPLPAAALGWQESGEVISFLGAPSSEALSDGVLRYAATFLDRTLDYTGAAARPVGLYVAWLWTYDSLGQATALPWDDASGRFVGAGVAATLARLDAPLARLPLAEVAGSSADQPRTPGFREPPIQAQPGWQVPLVEVGTLAPGGSANYSLTLTLQFDDAEAYQDWVGGGSFHVGAQGVVGPVAAVPEPAAAPLALLGLATLALALRRRPLG